MHCAGEFFCSIPRRTPLLAALFGSAWMAAASAAPVPALFAVTVADSDASRAAQQAMHIVLIRLLGTREAAEDPALAPLIEDAQHYVQLERNTTQGATQVIFDDAKLRAAVAATGRKVWNPDRPLLWVVLPTLSSAATEELRTQLTTAARLRALPIALVSADSSAGTDSPESANVAGALAAAHRAGADAALLAQPAAPDSQSLQWTLLAPGLQGHWTGGAAAAIDEATDALARASIEIDSAPLADIDCHIHGVALLPDLTAVLGAVSGAAGVTEIDIRSIVADELTLHLKAHGSRSELARALASGGLRADGANVADTLDYRYQSGR